MSGINAIPQPQPQPPSNGFTRWFSTHRNGAAGADAFEALQALVAAVRETGKKGSLTITLNVRPATKGIGGAFIVEDDVQVKAPKRERSQALYYGTEDNTLIRENPAQLTMELKTIDGAQEAAPLKQVAAQ